MHADPISLHSRPFPYTPGQYGALALVVEEAKAMTSAKGHKAPFRVERDSSDSSWWQALNQHMGLEAGRPGQRSCARAKPLMALPRESLAVLEKVHASYTHRLL